jgi:two-component system, NtrC family, sensor kinase
MPLRSFYAKLSVTVKLLVPSLSVFLTLWTLGTFSFGYLTRQNLEQSASQETEEIATVVLRELQQRQQLLQSQSRWVADREEVVRAAASGDQALLVRRLLPIQASLKLDLIKIVNPAGQVVAALVQGDIRQAKLQDADALSAASIGFETADVVVAEGNTPATIVGITALKSQNKVLSGVIVGMTVSEALLETLRTSPDKHLAVFQGQRLLATTLPAAKKTAWLAPDPSAAAQRRTIAQVPYLVKSVTLAGASNSQVTIVVLKSAQALQQSEQNLWLLVGAFGFLGGVIVAIVALAGAQVSRRLSRRLQGLTQATQQFADGNFHDRISIDSSDEVGQLAESFNAMATQLAARDQRIQQQMEQLEQTVEQLQQMQVQLVQSEKMSSLGHLVGGIAHEINNPIGFIHGNISHAKTYFQSLLSLIALYRQSYPSPPAAIQAELEEIELEFLTTDISKVLQSMQTGTERVQTIVQSLRSFSRLDESGVKWVDLHEGLDSTLLILQGRLRNQRQRVDIEVIIDYSSLPKVECHPREINQVFLNILSNAIEALEFRLQTDSSSSTEPPVLRIQTRQLGQDWVAITIADNGCGMTQQVQARLFDPFFTTKPIGKGTGLGLSISYQVVVGQHGGHLSYQSTPGEGTTCTIELPIHLRRTDALSSDVNFYKRLSTDWGDRSEILHE